MKIFLSYLVCTLFGHRLLPGVTLERSIVAFCPRCCRLVPGRLGVRP